MGVTKAERQRRRQKCFLRCLSLCLKNRTFVILIISCYNVGTKEIERMQKYDKIEIPEKYRKMSVSELAKEKERIYQTLTIQNTTDARKKASAGPIVFYM